MSTHPDRFVVHGELHITLEAVARFYEVEVAFLQEVRAYGLLRHVATVEGRLALAATELDDVACIVRLHRQAVDLPGIALFLAQRR